MDIRINEIYSLKGKGDLKFSLYELRTTKERVEIDGNGKKIKVPLQEGEVGVTQEELVKSNLTLDAAIELLLSKKMKDMKGEVDLKTWVEIYIKEKEEFQKAINNLRSVMSTKS